VLKVIAGARNEWIRGTTSLVTESLDAMSQKKGKRRNLISAKRGRRLTTMGKLLHAETAEAIEAAVRLGMESLRAEPPQRLGDWAQAEFCWPARAVTRRALGRPGPFRWASWIS
jgi:hypothetical protein